MADAWFYTKYFLNCIIFFAAIIKLIIILEIEIIKDHQQKSKTYQNLSISTQLNLQLSCINNRLQNHRKLSQLHVVHSNFSLEQQSEFVLSLIRGSFLIRRAQRIVLHGAEKQRFERIWIFEILILHRWHMNLHPMCCAIANLTVWSDGWEMLCERRLTGSRLAFPSNVTDTFSNSEDLQPPDALSRDFIVLRIQLAANIRLCHSIPTQFPSAVSHSRPRHWSIKANTRNQRPQLTFLILTFEEGISFVVANFGFDQLHENVVPPLGLLLARALHERRPVRRLD